MEFYNNAGRAIDLLDNKQGSLKSIVFTLAAGIDSNAKSSHHRSPRNHQRSHSAEEPTARRISDGKRLLRVVAESLRYRQVIISIVQKVDILNLESKVFAPSKASIQNAHSNRFKRLPRPESLLIVLVHDHLFSSRGISLAKIHKIRLAIERHSSELKSELSRLMVRTGVSQVAELIDHFTPHQSHSGSSEGPTTTSFNKIRWMRVNTIKWSLKDAITWFEEAGWNQVPLDTLIASSSNLIFAEDDHVAHLLALPSVVTLAKLTPYLDGRLIAQDKASCMPAQLLLGDRKDNTTINVIDATAAPGNKTTMLSAMVGQKGKVWAFERDKRRFGALQQMVEKAGCTRSGICNRLDHLSHTGSGKRDDDRIHSLSKFQTTIVSHALRFPSVNQVVYSTCSIWEEENEHVVLNILKKPEMIHEGWTLKDVEDAFLVNHKKPWVRAGQVISNEEKQLTERMIRFDPMTDQTNGFFAAVFLRPGADPIEDKDTISPSNPLTHTHANSMLLTKNFKDEATQMMCTWKGIRPGRLIALDPSCA